MTNRIFAMLLCCVMLLLCGCNTKPKKYKRISFESESLGEQLSGIKDDVIVMDNANNMFSAQMPIYTIKERNISGKEYEQMLDNLGIADYQSKPLTTFNLNGNRLHISLTSYTDFSRGYFDMTAEKVETLAWELFNKLPFLEGEYECVGIQNKYTVNDKEGDHIARAGVGFCRVVDGARVVGDESCVLYFDGSGLVEISIRLFAYEKIGIMDMVSLADAKSKLKSPDDFNIGSHSANNEVAMFQVEKVALRMVNQYSRGCTILQPIYYFTGTATYKDGYETNFSSKIIAIPEEMTYEED